METIEAKATKNKKLVRCQQELEALQNEFTAKIRQIRSKYFKESHQLIIMPGDGDREVKFSIDYCAFREPSAL